MFRLLLLLIAGIWLAMANAERFSKPAPRTASAESSADTDAGEATDTGSLSDVIQASLTIEPAPKPRRVELRRAPTETAKMVSFLNPVVIGDDGKILPPAFEPDVVAATGPVDVSTSEGADIPVFYVTARRVNVRAGPSTANPILGSVDIADAVQILSDPNEDWVKIRVEGDGVEGFMASRFLAETAPQD